MIASPSRKADGIARGETGSFTGDGTACTVTVGYRPHSVMLVNVTDVVTFNKIDPMADATTIKTVAGGTMTADGTSAIVLFDRGFIVSAAANINAKAFIFQID